VQAKKNVLPFPQEYQDMIESDYDEAKATISRQGHLKRLIYSLPEAKTEAEFNAITREISTKFPAAQSFLDFWTKISTIKSMIFPAVTNMKQKLLDHPTNTTNAIESFHTDLYLQIAKKGMLVNLKVKKGKNCNTMIKF
jgi:hypothetical protein